MVTPNKKAYFTFTPAAIPTTIKEKYITSSKEFFTGFLNLTIDSAPTIPRDKAILFEITLVTKKVIIGSNKQINVY